MKFYMRAARLAHSADNLSHKFLRSVSPANTAALRVLAEEFEDFQKDVAADPKMLKRAPRQGNYDDPEDYIPNILLRHAERLRLAVHDAEIPGMDPRNYRRVNAIRLVLVSACRDVVDIVPALWHYGPEK